MFNILEVINMEPELEKSKVAVEVLSRKVNGNVPYHQDFKLLQCTSNYEEKNRPPRVSTGFEDMDVNIIECTNSCNNGQVETRCEDSVESKSSFGDTSSENASFFSDMEVESHSRFDDDCGSEFQMRRKRLTDHWRRFIRPLMWRCKWLELQIKSIRSQSLKYDRELEEHAQRKMFDFHTFVVRGFDAKSLPFISCTQRKKSMKRKKRKRVEEVTDVTSYMLQHNVFSYYENRKSAVNFGSINGDCSNHDKAIDATDEFWLEDELPSFESKGDDNICETFLRKIEVLQSEVRKLKGRIEKVVSENAGKFLANRLSMPAPSDVFTNSDQNPASAPENGEQLPVRSMYTSSQYLSDFSMGDLLT